MSGSYQALLLAAGKGTRLQPLTLSTPKCLVPILGRPLLSYWLELFNRGPEPSKIWVNCSYLSEQVEDYLKKAASKYPRANIAQFFEPNLLGTAGTVQALMSEFNPSQNLLLAHADNLSWFDLRSFLGAHLSRPTGMELTMMTFQTDSPQTCGIVELDQNGAMRHFYEKDPSAPGNLANGAVYLISPEGLKRIRSLGKITEFSTQVIPAFVDKIYCWHNATYHRDIGTPDSYRLAQSEFQSIASEFNLFNE